MGTTLGLDIGSNSVGSAWVDEETKEIRVGVSVFPAGVEEKDEGRGAPKNQDRREKRSLRRSIARRSARKRKLRRFLVEHGLLPLERESWNALMATDAWQIRRDGLKRQLAPYEFGRVLLHISQRRGALGLRLFEKDDETNEESPENVKRNKKKAAEPDNEGKVKAAVEATNQAMLAHGAATFGELMAILMHKRREPVVGRDGNQKHNLAGELTTYSNRIRNEAGNFEFHADRAMLRDEFNQLWEAQRRFKSPLSEILTDEIKKQLDDPSGDKTWRHRGILFGQRRTYWNTGTLGRCSLEPTDQCVAIADRHASFYRVIETANNIRVRGPQDRDFRPLTPEERQKIITKLQSQKLGTVACIRAALDISKAALKKRGVPENAYALNLERDEDREINTDWFYREIVLGGVGEATWKSWGEGKREGLNRAILRFDPALDDDLLKFSAIAVKLGLDSATTQRLITGWRTRPKLERRLKLSRRAIRNLSPLMDSFFMLNERPKDFSADVGAIELFSLAECEFDPVRHRWLTQIDARMAFARKLKEKSIDSNGEIEDLSIKNQIFRYELGSGRINKRDRYYLKKHPELVLPPAPMLSNPVVRKAIHEVRRHVIAHIRAAGKKPDRIVIEYARETTKPAKLNDEILFRNRLREKVRRRIRDEVLQPAHGDMYFSLSTNQLRAAEDRVILCEQQREVCAYSGKTITVRQAALGNGLEIDHVIPYSRCGDNSLNNRVLCYRDSNRNKQNHTPREWWKHQFDDHILPMKFMDGFRPDRKVDYFTMRDYAAKWRNLSRENVSADWKGSQLSDTAYAAKEVEAYLQQSLWPDEKTFLAGGTVRRIFVTKGSYTAQLRRDWQLYQRNFSDGDSREERVRATAKDRGDHREHAIDAVAIAFTDPARIQALAEVIKQQQERWLRAKNSGSKPEKLKRQPLPTPWSNAQNFRRQVLSLIYDVFDDSGPSTMTPENCRSIVVSHRPVGRRLTGKFHEETLFGPVPQDATLFTGFVRVTDLDPNHLRMPVPEKPKEAIERLALRYVRLGIESDFKKAKKRAKALIETSGYVPKLVDPPPGKSGLIRDIGMRKQVRRAIEERLDAANIERDADSFTEKDLKQILNPVNPATGKPEFRSLTMSSGVPIKRLVLLRTMNDPIVVPRRCWNENSQRWEIDESPRAARAYVSGNNHHIEIRTNDKNAWSGVIVSMHKASVRARIKKLDPVDRSDDPESGGRFVMSLAEGETVFMMHKQTLKPGYFVVFKLDKPATIQFKAHWDARRAKGEKDEQGLLIPDSERESMAVSAAQLADLAPPGEATPIKVVVDPLGRVHRVEPLPEPSGNESEIDPRVMAIAREAVAARKAKRPLDDSKKRRLHGSWSWMRARLKRENLGHLASQLSAAVRIIQ
jgi:CRISPR-associated endonuclease Csn1